ncbi:MAG: tetratricopeptide repeat protein [Chloroflexota bacterium]
MDRARILYDQRRFELAAAEIRRALVADPNNHLAHGLLALCLSQTDQHAEAVAAAGEAVRLAPDEPFAHYALGHALLGAERLSDAEAAASEAVRLDPEDADNFALLAAIRAERGRWRQVLQAAEEGLALDPEHPSCTNFRAMAQVRLRQHRAAGKTIETALARDPENAFTHANQGWALLHQANHDQALVHFREALRLRPDSDWAREGLITALKAKHRLYGLLLRYFLWMSTLAPRVRWGVMLGAYFLYEILRVVARRNAELAPWITPVLLFYTAFAVLTWVADPLFDLLLRLDRFGRYALTREQEQAANLVGACLVGALVALLVGLLTGQTVAFLAVLVCGLLMVPVAAIFKCRAGRARTGMALYTGLLAVLVLAGLGLLALQPRQAAGSVLLVLALGGAFLSTWIANFAVAARGRG